MKSDVARFPIGQQFMTRGKHPRLCTIIDIHRTYDAHKRFVKLRYVASHLFMGRPVLDFDVCDVTVARGIASMTEAA